jgi:DNA-binding transcriptional ArsR family regulator
MKKDLRTLVDQLKAVSHPLRLRVLALLGTGEFCVCQVAEILHVPQSSVSEALRELRRADFLEERKEGRWVFVSVVPEARATPLLKALLGEAGSLPEARQDQAEAARVLGLPLPIPCPASSAYVEAAHA